MKYPRLFEFADQKWIPLWYKINLRRYLSFYYKCFQYHKLWIQAVEEFILKNSKEDTFLECCSGAGDCLPMILKSASPEVLAEKQFILSDLYPFKTFVSATNTSKQSSYFKYYSKSVDATQVPKELNHPRIFINSFHHLSPDLAKKVLLNSLEQGKGILILEYVSHSFLGYLSMIAGASLVFFTAPFVVRFKDLPWVLLFTYILPLFPIMLLWDGVISCLRSYKKDDFKEWLCKDDEILEITEYKDRSLLYPAGVSAISVMPKPMGSTMLKTCISA